MDVGVVCVVDLYGRKAQCAGLFRFFYGEQLSTGV